MTQDQALSILKTGANVFLTGEPGAGKTHTVNAYVRALREMGIEPAITASTGIAATHIHGMTIHSWSGIGIRRDLTAHDLDRISSNEFLAKRITKAKILIIDEISMLDRTSLDLVDIVCKEVRRSEQPFGGLQVILVGDFFQLPPVAKNTFFEPQDIQLFEDFEEDTASNFAFQSNAWRSLSPIVCYLTEQHRQEDEEFLGVLSAIRSGSVLSDHISIIEKRKIQRTALPDGVTKLFSHNADVDRVNRESLAKIPGNAKTFLMSSSGSEFVVMSLKKGCLSPETLELKPGAVVMFTKNNPQNGYANGTLGTVIGFNGGTGSPIVQTRSGRQIVVEPVEWAVEEGGKARARISQLPLRLAWAITIHKSQGMSMDAAVIDLSAAFEFGQGYVALSRVRTLNGLHLLGWNDQALKVNPSIARKDGEFRGSSNDADAAFGDMDKAELEKMHDNFITACGGKKKAPAKAAGAKGAKSAGVPLAPGEKTKLEQTREKYPNAYRPWPKEEDEKLKTLFESGEGIANLVKAFGRQRGSIRARLIKLGLIEE